MTDRIACTDKLPDDNQPVVVFWGGMPRFARFVTTSDGDYFWDNLVDCVYHPHEIRQWMPILEWAKEESPRRG